MGDIGRDTPTREELATILKVAKATARSCGANNDEADEIAQSTVVRLWSKWNEENVRRARHRGSVRWRGYVRRTARNLHLDRIREHQRRLARQLKAEGQLPGSPATPGSTFAPVCPCAVDALLARAAIAEEIFHLPREQRIVAALFFLESMTVPEIARRRGVQDQSVRKHLRAARATLRQRLSEAEKLPL
jgi:RNA polymerase sigma-70 factor (ECF subfamily)